MTTVLIADDHAAIRAGLRLMLEAAPDLEVVGEAADGAVAIRNARALRPDVVLMDVRMPGTDGIEATRALAADGVAVLVLTTYDEDEAVFGAIRAGAAGFLLKTVDAPDLVAAVRRVAAGEGAIAPAVARRVLAAVSGESGVPGGSPGEADAQRRRAARSRLEAAGLTPRERAILAEIGEGASNGEIARRGGITLGTTKSHVSRILAKLGVDSRTRAALLARDAGLTGFVGGPG